MTGLRLHVIGYASYLLQGRVPHAGTGHHRWRTDRNPAMLFVDYSQNARDHAIASASIRGAGVNG